MNEEQILLQNTERQIAHAFRDARDRSSAISDVRACIEQNLGGRALLLLVPSRRVGKALSVARYAEHFFSETTALPYRSLYTVQLFRHGREWGRLVVFFAWGCFYDGMAASLVKRIGEELERARPLSMQGAA